ncbi:hypothetical protein GYMLUDRAFT_507602 [Collybiopsis luxurians FD-317 M1]|uniref:Uncharacterized protein n=1 Tax=Collybiopsis luxurians FD-317 M1 TaxID=944289 RepID=A0A0D0B7H2_9AGAR|nr:hypothetical protein GYMLUDRAFT_507602 [Collybiopsis luxurians FD-317 M1]
MGVRSSGAFWCRSWCFLFVGRDASCGGPGRTLRFCCDLSSDECTNSEALGKIHSLCLHIYMNRWRPLRLNGKAEVVPMLMEKEVLQMSIMGCWYLGKLVRWIVSSFDFLLHNRN